MKMPSYVKSEFNRERGNKIFATLSLTRFPYELVIPNLIKIVGFRFWLYPKVIIGLLKIKKDFKVTT